jgi:hypothetical protein
LDEALVAVKQACVEGLRAISDKNAALLIRWDNHFHACSDRFHSVLEAFNRETTSFFNLDLNEAPIISPEMLKRKLELDEAMDALERPHRECLRAYNDKNSALILHWYERFESCRARHQTLLDAFRRDYFS